MFRFQVEEALCKLIRQNGGRLRANLLHRLYRRLPDARDVISDAGGLRRFCDESDELFFAPDKGCGEVRLRPGGPVRAYAVDSARERELERQLAAAKKAKKSAKKAKAKAEAQAEAEAASRAELRRELNEAKEQAQRFCGEAYAAEQEKTRALAVADKFADKVAKVSGATRPPPRAQSATRTD